MAKEKSEAQTLKLFCSWCLHKDTYYVGKYDQPKCTKCFKFISKKENRL